MIEENILKNFAGKNVVVTGGTGLIGREVVKDFGSG
jgi:FlaA1/EpsC-like NDP-sugar epimerase